MNAARQDAWTDAEDRLLAETVLHHIRQGATQLEAFKEVAEQLSRTPAACGFRWNASIRQEYSEAIEKAKVERRQMTQKQAFEMDKLNTQSLDKTDPVSTAISLLEQLRYVSPDNKNHDFYYRTYDEAYKQLIEENKTLKEQLKRYDQAWEEMGKLWNWVKEQDD